MNSTKYSKFASETESSRIVKWKSTVPICLETVMYSSKRESSISPNPGFKELRQQRKKIESMM